jgi:hypothetical protein
MSLREGFIVDCRIFSFIDEACFWPLKLDCKMYLFVKCLVLVISNVIFIGRVF